MDISRLEQISLCVRYVTNDLVINERFLGLWSTATTDGATVYTFDRYFTESRSVSKPGSCTMLTTEHQICEEGTLA